MKSSVRLKQSSTKRTYNSFPRFAVKWNVTKSRHRFHVRHAGATAASRTRPGHRLAAANLPLLVYQEAEANH